MAEEPAFGIDLNGLLDAVASGSPVSITRGAIPSVVLPLAHRKNVIEVIAGAEASRAIEGRGWSWPEAAKDPASRIPIAEIFERLHTDVAAAENEAGPADLIAAAIDALTGLTLLPTARRNVLALSDNGRFNEEVRQALIDACARRRRQVTLLWRSVAAFLGVEPQLRPYTNLIAGYQVGVVTIAADGIEASAFQIEAAEASGTRYLVPVRRRAGIRAAFEQSLYDRAAALAAQWLPSDPAGGRQLVWGSGLAIKRLLGETTAAELVQDQGRWRFVDGQKSITVNLPETRPADVKAIASALSDCRIVVFEGPGLYARGPDGEHLLHKIKDQLALSAQPFFEPPGGYYAARGCAAFAWRKLQRWRTYSDFLPQLRISTRIDGKATFLPLIPPDARADGGEAYRKKLDLGFKLPKGVATLNVFLLKDGERDSRSASLVFRSPPADDVRIGIEVVQQPAQGRARLTLVPLDGAGVPPLEVNWGEMQIDARGEIEILAELNQSKLRVPPTVAIPAHELLWTSSIGGERLIDLVRQPTGQDFARRLAKHLRRLDSPWRITHYASPNRSRVRAIGTDGSVPEAAGELIASDIAAFDQALERLSKLRGNARPAAVIACSWAFARCPTDIVDQLEAVASWKPTASVGEINAMGRVFIKDKHFHALYGFLARIAEFKQQHISALFSVLSLREDAARWLTENQAEYFAKQALAVLSTELRERRFKRRCRAVIQLIAALLRYRVEDPQFLASGSSKLAMRIEEKLAAIRDRSPELKVTELAIATIDYLHDRGIDANILEHEPEEQEEDAE
jgi:hypothetical protein